MRVFGLLLLLGACGSNEPTPPPETPPPPPVVTHPPPPETPPPPPPSSPIPTPAAPSSGCTFAAPALLAEHAGPIAITAYEHSFVTVIYGDFGDLVRVVSVDSTGAHPLPPTYAGAARSGRPQRDIHTGILLYRAGGPAIAARDNQVAVAIVAPDRQLLLTVFDPAQPSYEWHPIAAFGASERFDLALASSPAGWAIAWTDERQTPMRVYARVVDDDGAGPDAQDLTPRGGGAAAPVFLRGTSAPMLAFIDPRVAISVVHRSVLAGNSFGPAEVLRPVSNAAEPPEIAGLRSGGIYWIGYTAVGSVATSAVGLVRAGDQAPAVPIVPGRGYGVLHVDAAVSGEHAIFIADSPIDTPPSAPREVQVRELHEGVLSAPIIVRGPGGDASRGRIARAADGQLAIAFLSGGSAYVTLGRCAE